MNCDNCHSKNIKTNPISQEFVCAECGVVQLEPVLDTSKLYSFNIKKHQTEFPKFKRLEKLNYMTTNTTQKMLRQNAILQTLSKLTDSKLEFNEEVKQRVLEINELIRSIPENAKTKHRFTLVVAIIFFMTKNKLMTMADVFKKLKISKVRSYLKVFEVAKQKIDYKRLGPESIRQNLIYKLFQNTEFINRMLRVGATKNKIIEVINTDFNNQITKYKDEQQEKTTIIARVIYDILNTYNEKLITQRLMGNIANVPEFTLRLYKI